jgi:phosphate transport system substrate-binding protein
MTRNLATPAARPTRALLLLACAAVTLASRPAGGEDLSSLPEYRPGARVSGRLRSWGSTQMATVMKYWEEGFRKYQPAVEFVDTLKGTASAQYGLQEWVADLALMNREIWPYEYYGTFRRSLIFPVQIAVATGSYDVPHKAYALSVFVHKDNPLSKLTVKQLDRIFGAERPGGWQGLYWRPEVARTPKDDIRTWGQLGLTGAWADKPIHVYGPPILGEGAVSFFQARVMGGGDTWNEDLREYADRELMIAALGSDRYGIAYTGMCYRTPQVKPVAMADTEQGPFVEPSRQTVADRSYPLARSVYIYFTVDTETGDAADPLVQPKVGEFLRYVLSRQGQQDVVRDGDYLPLTADMVRRERGTLDSKDLGQRRGVGPAGREP